MQRELKAVSGVVAIAVCATAVLVVGQSAHDRGRDIWTEAMRLLEVGEVHAAQSVLEKVAPGDPRFGSARRYLALCKHLQGDWQGFLKTVDGLDLDAPVVPPQVREELAFAHVQALFRARRFDDLLAHSAVFAQKHPGWARTAAVRELRLAGLYERGIKKAIEAAQLTDPTKSSARLTRARIDLSEFLKEVEGLGVQGYVTIPKRDLQREVWAAGIVLGQEARLEAEVQGKDSATQEKFDLLRIELHRKLHPRDDEKAVQMMDQFLDRYPGSRARARVQYELLRLCFHVGERLAKQAKEVERTGNSELAGALRTAARQYFDRVRAHAALVVVDPAAGISESDIADLRQEYLGTYFWAGQYLELETEAKRQIERTAPGQRDWYSGSTWLGMALASQGPARLAEAAEVLDAVLARGFTGDAEIDTAVSYAAKWRAYVAFQLNDPQKAAEVLAWIKTANCPERLKKDFERVYSSLIAQ